MSIPNSNSSRKYHRKHPHPLRRIRIRNRHSPADAQRV